MPVGSFMQPSVGGKRASMTCVWICTIDIYVRAIRASEKMSHTLKSSDFTSRQEELLRRSQVSNAEAERLFKVRGWIVSEHANRVHPVTRPVVEQPTLPTIYLLHQRWSAYPRAGMTGHMVPHPAVCCSHRPLSHCVGRCDMWVYKAGTCFLL